MRLHPRFVHDYSTSVRLYNSHLYLKAKVFFFNFKLLLYQVQNIGEIRYLEPPMSNKRAFVILELHCKGIVN